MAVELLPGNELFIIRLRDLEHRCTNFTPAFAIIDMMMLAYESLRFESEGPNWARLAPATELRKISMPYQQILQRGEPGHSEGLKQSLTTHGQGSLFAMTPLSLTMGTSVSYATYHQKGFSDRGGGEVPARPPFPSIQQMPLIWATWKTILQAYLVGGSAAAATTGAGMTLSNGV